MNVTLIQTPSGDDKTANPKHVEAMLGAAIIQDRPDLVILPEVFTYLGGTVEGAQAPAKTLPGGAADTMLQSVAREHAVWARGVLSGADQ